MQEPSSLADAILEIPASELQHFFDDLALTYNSLNDLLKDQGILRGRELAELNTRANQCVKVARSPMEKMLALNAYIRQQIGHVKRAMQARPPTAPTDQGVIRQAITKIGLRALAIVEHVKIIAEGKKEVAFNSAQTRDFLAGREGKPPSRRDTIRALRRAEKLCPALLCGHTPGDGRQTMRLTAKTDNLRHSDIIKDDRDLAQRQRSRMEEIKVIFFKEEVRHSGF
ncbi:MAG: hypothetical protein M0Q13_14985 [Methanothrix sp.]|jgi:ElaB/YqjD/DUF883 family membrane-anchored ribosome-binding protein|nr:hypothetical protein [Methanothrix sp.]